MSSVPKYLLRFCRVRFQLSVSRPSRRHAKPLPLQEKKKADTVSERESYTESEGGQGMGWSWFKMLPLFIILLLLPIEGAIKYLVRECRHGVMCMLVYGDSTPSCGDISWVDNCNRKTLNQN